MQECQIIRGIQLCRCFSRCMMFLGNVETFWRPAIKSDDIPNDRKFVQKWLCINDLLNWAKIDRNPAWHQITCEPGVYLVCWRLGKPLSFQADTAKYATSMPPSELEKKWEEINDTIKTDILYIGTSVNLRERLKQLAKFGIGRAENHKGGEWLWQIQGINGTDILVCPCPPKEYKSFENYLLERFLNEHGLLSLANRDKPSKYSKKWYP